MKIRIYVWDNDDEFVFLREETGVEKVEDSKYSYYVTYTDGREEEYSKNSFLIYKSY